MIRFSKKFEDDYRWYVSMLEIFNFDGKAHYFNKQGEDLVQYAKEGLTAKECFYIYDSRGVIEKTREEIMLLKLYKTKGSVNLHIKMYAEDRAKGYLPRVEFDKICIEYNMPKWVSKAVENQKFKHYNKHLHNEQ